MITCGGDSDVRVYEDIDEDSVAEFSVASDRVTAIVCWYTNDQVRFSTGKIRSLFTKNVLLSN